ncbi:MAG: hypothetical protein KC800_20800 [Candidatus Eremiobacteraeota bacterium]|nr:hypothetical protein [Candidatus Eremiobacteraeota bacterium]
MKHLFLAAVSFILLVGCSPQQTPIGTTTPAEATNTPALVTPTPEQAQVPVDAAAWMVGKEFSIAAIMRGRGMSDADVANASGAANEMAAILELPPLPPLPAKPPEGDSTTGLAEALAYILDNGKPLAAVIREKHGEKAAALFEQAYRTTLIGLLYEPGDENSVAYANQLEKVGLEYSLPSDLWQPVVESIKAGEEGDVVRRHIAKMSAQMAPQLAGQ